MKTNAQLAKDLVDRSLTATLCTLITETSSGETYPFGSLVATAIDPEGRPILLLSTLAEHTKNLSTNPRASVFFARHDVSNPLAEARVTLTGKIERMAEEDVAEARTRYLAKHPEAAQWAQFKDFAFYRLAVHEIRFVEGFGKMGWLDVEEYTALWP